MSNQEIAPSRTMNADASFRPLAGKWTKQLFVTSLLVGPAIGLFVASTLFYLAPKKYASHAELHYSSIDAEQKISSEMLQAELKKINDPRLFAETIEILKSLYKDSTVPPELTTDIKGSIITISTKHEDPAYARDVISVLIRENQKRLKRERTSDTTSAEAAVDQLVSAQSKLPADAQKQLLLQNRLYLIETAKDRYDLLVLYAAEPITFRQKLLDYQRDYLSREVIHIDSTKAHSSETPRQKDLDLRWTELRGLMRQHREQLQAEIATLASTGNNLSANPTLTFAQKNGFITQVREPLIARTSEEPVMSSYLVTGSISGLLILPLLSLLGSIRQLSKHAHTFSQPEAP
jgi:hypothetical protein